MEKKFIDIRVTAICDDDLISFLLALRKIQLCGEIGANRLLPIQIDGDGSGFIDVEIHTKECSANNLKNLREIATISQTDLNRVKDGYDFKTHYIGE